MSVQRLIPGKLYRITSSEALNFWDEAALRDFVGDNKLLPRPGHTMHLDREHDSLIMFICKYTPDESDVLSKMFKDTRADGVYRFLIKDRVMVLWADVNCLELAQGNKREGKSDPLVNPPGGAPP